MSGTPPPLDLLPQLQAVIEAHNLLPTGARVLVAVSGGVDSMCLLDLLVRAGYRPGVAHAHFGLRGEEADGDAHLVAQVAAKHRLPFHRHQFATQQFAEQHDLSIQAAARRLRYRWFAELERNYGYTHVVTAHHADDQAETVLYSLTRNKGLSVLEPIPMRRGSLVRPLLWATKQDLMAYAVTYAVPYRADRSNATADYNRNHLRHNVIPQLQSLNPRLTVHLAERAQHQQHLMAWAQRRLEAETAGRFESVGLHRRLHLGGLDRLSDSDRYMQLYYCLRERLGLRFTELQRCIELIDLPTGRQVLTEKYRVVRERSALLFFDLSAQTEPWELRPQLNTWQPLPVGYSIMMQRKPFRANFDYRSRPSLIYLAGDVLEGTLVVRSPQPGDRIRPFGLQEGSKLVTDAMSDAKFDALQKDAAFVIADDLEIRYLFGYRVAESARITPETQWVLKVRIAAH